MDNEFNQIFDIMAEAFPESEYRSYEEQKKLLLKDFYKIISYKDKGNNVIAFMSYWQFNDFAFVEHLAINKDYRGKGIGSKLLREFIENNEKKLVILEVELPRDEISRKRIRFYEKLGFNLNLYPYEQLPLRIEFNNIPMYIMSYPRKINESEFMEIKAKLHRDVYKA